MHANIHVVLSYTVRLILKQTKEQKCGKEESAEEVIKMLLLLTANTCRYLTHSLHAHAHKTSEYIQHAIAAS